MSEASEHIQYFHTIRNTLDPGFHRGDEYDDRSVIFHTFPFADRGIYDFYTSRVAKSAMGNSFDIWNL